MAARSSHQERRRGREGQGLVEFALIVPALFLLVFGIVDIGRVLHAYVTVNHAAREGARYATTGQQMDLGGGSYASRPNSIATRTTGSLSGLKLDPAAPSQKAFGFYDVRLNPSSGGQPNDYVEVEVAYNVAILTPLISSIVPNVLVTGRQRMINESFGSVPLLDRGNIPPTPITLPTYTPWGTRSPTSTPSVTGTATSTATQTLTATATYTHTPTITATATKTSTPTITATATSTSTTTRTATRTATATPCTGPTISGLTAYSDSSNSNYLTVTWTTSAAADSNVSWTGNPSGSGGSGTLSTSHSVKTTMRSYRSYTYVVSSTNSCGATTTVNRSWP